MNTTAVTIILYFSIIVGSLIILSGVYSAVAYKGDLPKRLERLGAIMPGVAFWFIALTYTVSNLYLKIIFPILALILLIFGRAIYELILFGWIIKDDSN